MQAQNPAVADLGFARLDLDRARRTGTPEVVLGTGKTPAQIHTILAQLAGAHPDRPVLATRVDEPARTLCRGLPGAVVDDLGRTVVLGPARNRLGTVTVVTAGTGDLPIAHEAMTTVEVFGAHCQLIADVGVAGLHRLLAVQDQLDNSDVLVVVAGMDAALPSVVGGLTGVPLIAVPTSVGYGWNLDGVSAWLSMVNSCSAGVLTVNVDNGFGAGVAAARIARASNRSHTAHPKNKQSADHQPADRTGQART